MQYKVQKQSFISNDFFQNQNQQLPSNFAEQILYLECEMEKPHINIDEVNQLLELYRIAIEYYGLQQNDFYQVFKKKTQNLLLKPNVVLLLNDGDKENKRNHSNSINKQKSFEYNIEVAKQQITPIQVQQMVIKEKESNIMQIKLVEEQLARQEIQINQRLLNRQNSKLLTAIQCQQETIWETCSPNDYQGNDVDYEFRIE